MINIPAKGNITGNQLIKRHFRRYLWLAVILIALALYLLVNRVAGDGVQLILPIDKLIPLYPPAIAPYLLGDLLFVALPVWAAIYVRPKEFEAYAISILSATMVSYLIYLIFPTFVVRPEVVPDDLFSKIIALLYHTDRVYNAAPSGHTFYSVLSLLYLRRWQPKYEPVWWLCASLIILSTLFTRQHYVLDVVAGLVFGVLAYMAGRLAQRKWNLRFASAPDR